MGPVTSRRRFRARPKWHNLGQAYNPRTPAQERRQKLPRAFTRRAEWRYGNNRTEEREARVKQQAKTLLAVNRKAGNVWDWIKRRVLGIQPYRPDRIDPDHYHVEV